ncbi:WAGO-2 protein, partial [Aphelenchoides avenae]
MSQRGSSRASQSATTDSGGASKRDVKRRKDEVIQAMKDLNLSEGNPIMDPKKPPGEWGTGIRLDSNVYGMRTGNAKVYRYDVTITGVLLDRRGRERIVEFTKRTREDAVVVDRKDKSRVAFRSVVRCNPQDFGEDPTALYYDLQSVLYTLQELDLQGRNDKSFEVLADQMNQEEWDALKIESLARIDMLVKKVSSNFVISLDDFSAITDDVSLIDHSVLTFLELATSQYALFTP